MNIKEQTEKLCANVKYNEPMKNHTTFRIGGNADIFCEPSGEKELSDLILFFRKENLPYVVLGNGSNVLVGDNGIRGTVIKIGSKMSGAEVKGEKLYAQGGILLSRLAKIAMNESLSGMENISGIPGSLGGAIYMNAGAYGSEISEILEEVTFVTQTGQIKTLKADELMMGYRKSIFMENGGIVASAVIKLHKGDKAQIEKNMAEITKRRVDKQPLDLPSAGSTFKRPEGHFAGKLIEDSNLKGFGIGGAKISEKHAGFIVNYNNATAADVMAVIKHAQDTVYEKFGVKIEPEVKFLG